MGRPLSALMPAPVRTKTRSVGEMEMVVMFKRVHCLYAVADHLDGAKGAEGCALLPAEIVADVVADEVDGAVGLDQGFVAGA